jgi:uncharacterized protein
MFQWDDGNIDHLARHGVVPAEAEQVLNNDPFVVAEDERSGEPRILQIGETDANRVLMVVITPRGDLTRVVTAFQANRKYRELYAALKRQGYGEEDRNT